MMDDRLNPLEMIEESIHFWWVLVLLMVLGGTAAYLIFLTTPPVFEARGVFSMVIDYTKTEKMTDIEADQAIVAAGDLFFSNNVVDAVVREAGKKGIVITAADFRQKAFVDRTNSEWVLRTRNESAETAAALVNIWADQSLIAISDGLSHAVLSSFYQRQLDSLERCVEQVPAVEPSAPVCGYGTLLELQQAVSSASAKEKEETGLSQGLISSLNITLTNRSDPRGQLVGEGRSIYILAGSFLGMICFIFIYPVLLSRVTANRAV